MNKERPILFSGEMVRAILDGRKTKTRRVVKHIPALGAPGEWCHRADTDDFKHITGHCHFFCPYGVPGDRLWVRETWATCRYCNDRPPRETNNHGLPFWYAADNTVRYTGATEGGPGFMTRGNWRPSIHMPRWAIRIMLEIVSVRVERLNEISQVDAQAEGIQWQNCAWGEQGRSHAWAAYKDLWERINGPGSWAINPWVWVIEFKSVEV